MLQTETNEHPIKHGQKKIEKNCFTNSNSDNQENTQQQNMLKLLKTSGKTFTKMTPSHLGLSVPCALFERRDATDFQSRACVAWREKSFSSADQNHVSGLPGPSARSLSINTGQFLAFILPKGTCMIDTDIKNRQIFFSNIRKYSEGNIVCSDILLYKK